ncbi:hypothetical protein MYX75_04130 [Acidobacteria bacterium AH-259-A15]|nr:hypothetical protein [Acidobacteria bacterium AH-259-A15]
MKGQQYIIFTTLLILLLILVFLAMTQEVRAIPAFARKYETSCQTCHVAFPKLNAFGEAFRNNGYRFPAGDEEVVQEKPVSLGSPSWKRLWPKTIWPSDIPALPPVGLLITNRFDMRPGEAVSNDFATPKEVELFSGGTFGEDLSFLATLTLLDENEFGGLHRLFGQFDSIKGNSLFNVKFGGFELRAVPFSSHRRLLKTNYLMNNLQAGIDSALAGEVEIRHAHGGSDVFSFASAQRGVEVWGANSGPGGGGLTYGFGIVNGNGLGGFTLAPGPMEMADEHGDEHAQNNGILPLQAEHGDEPGADDHGQGHGLRFLDNNSSKDVYWRAAYKFFGLGLTGRSGPGSEQKVLQTTDNWVDDSIRIGTFGIRGKTRGGPGLLEDEDYLRWGADIDIWFRDLNLFGAYMWGRNEQPSHDGLLEMKMNSWFVEADYVLLPWVIPALRYEVAEFKPVRQAGAAIFDELPTIRRIVPHVTLLLRANVKLVFESQHYFNNFSNNIYQVGLDFAF